MAYDSTADSQCHVQHSVVLVSQSRIQCLSLVCGFSELLSCDRAVFLAIYQLVNLHNCWLLYVSGCSVL